MKLFPLFKKKPSAQDKGWRVGGLEDFMTLIRVYYQAVLAGNLGISNLAALPDLRVFKQALHVPTVNNKLGVGEKNRCKKMLGEIYGLPSSFFQEIDASIKRNCRNVSQVQTFLYTFQGFTQELMMLVGNLMKWKFRVPSFMRSALRTLTEKTIHDIMTKEKWKDAGQRKSVMTVRHYRHQLGYSEAWMTELVFHILILAKKEPKPKDQDEKKK